VFTGVGYGSVGSSWFRVLAGDEEMAAFEAGQDDGEGEDADGGVLSDAG
jgi:hypothetical protein